MNRKIRKSHLPQITLALALLVGSFSLFSVAFGIQKSYVFNLSNETSKEIRLEQKQSDEINDFLLRETDEPEIEAKYILQHLEKLGSIHANSFLVGDLDTGEIIFERKPHTTYPIASITKYMTAFTAAKVLEPNELALITKEKLKVEGSRGGFTIGDELTIKSLLYPLLLVSSNDAGEIIAQQRDRYGFIQKMNTLAKENALLNTSFQDPTGLSQNNISTARDLFKMMRVIKTTYPQIVNISKLNLIQKDGYTWRNINKASLFPEFKGGKTGYTNAARQTSIGYYEIKLANDQIKNIGIIILQSDTRQTDTRNILNYLKTYVAYL